MVVSEQSNRMLTDQDNWLLVQVDNNLRHFQTVPQELSNLIDAGFVEDHGFKADFSYTEPRFSLTGQGRAYMRALSI